MLMILTLLQIFQDTSNKKPTNVKVNKISHSFNTNCQPGWVVM